MRSVMTRALRWEAAFAAALLVVAGLLGYLLGGLTGVWGALLGVALAVVFMGLTTLSFLLGERLGRGRPPMDALVPMLVVIGGTWVVKVVAYLVLIIWLRTQTWLNPTVFGVTAIIAVVGSLLIDAVAMARTRVPIVDLAAAGNGSDVRDDRAEPSENGQTS